MGLKAKARCVVRCEKRRKQAEREFSQTRALCLHNGYLKESAWVRPGRSDSAKAASHFLKNQSNTNKTQTRNKVKREGKVRMKITEVGQSCRHCNTPVEERSHPQPSKRNPSGYWYSRWLLCPRCHAMYMLESEKMGYDGLPFKESDHKQRWNRATVAPQPPTMSRWSPLDCGAGNDPRDVPWNE